MKTKYKPIAMRCTQEQFDSIKDMIPLPIEQVLSFEMYDYLTNNYEKQRVVSNIKREKIANYDRVMYEIFDGELFLDCCGGSKYKRSNRIMKIDETKLNEEIKKLEDLRDEWPFTSAEYIDIDDQIKAIESIIKKCTIK